MAEHAGLGWWLIGILPPLAGGVCWSQACSLRSCLQEPLMLRVCLGRTHAFTKPFLHGVYCVEAWWRRSVASADTLVASKPAELF